MNRLSQQDIFIQRNKDRMDFDTLVGVFADKFNVDRIEAEEIIMRKTKKVNEKYDWLEKEISLEGKIKGEDYIISFSPYMFNNTYQVEILKKENGVLEIVFSKNNARGGSVEQIFASIFNFFNLPMPKTNDLSSGLNVNIMIDTLINRYDFNLKENNKKGDNIMRKVKEEEKKEENIIEVEREVKIGDVILEKGDRIRVLNEGLETDTVRYYAYYASAIINDDFSGVDDQEEEAIRAFLDWVKKEYGPEAQVVDVSEESHFGRPASYIPSEAGVLAGDMLDYTILYRE